MCGMVLETLSIDSVCRYGLYSYALYNHGLNRYGLDSHGLYSYGPIWPRHGRLRDLVRRLVGLVVGLVHTGPIEQPLAIEAIGLGARVDVEPFGRKAVTRERVRRDQHPNLRAQRVDGELTCRP